jgi:hypothetical protein
VWHKFLAGGGPTLPPEPAATPIPDLPASNVVYASPDGDAGGAGTELDPLDLATAITQSQSGSNVVLLDGLYTYDGTLAFGVQAEPAAAVTIYGQGRPVITRSDGDAPQVRNGHNVTMYNVWLVGTAKTNMTTCQHGNDAKWLNCVLAGYKDTALNEGASVRNFYRGNRFVNNGSGTLHHSIYISDETRDAGEGVTIEENILIGGSAYHIHLWHEPKWCVIRYNFSALAVNNLAIDGAGHLVEKNILWSNSGNPSVNFSATDYVFRNNVIGSGTVAGAAIASPTEVISRNKFVGSATLYGAESTRWDDSAVAANLGKTGAEIDAATAAINTAFTTQTAAQIQADATIEAHFATLASVITAWKAAP